MNHSFRVTVLLSWLLLQGGACGPDETLLIVEVSGRPASVKSLRLSVMFNDRQATPSQQVSDSLDAFGLLLPAEASGSFRLSANGLDAAGCITAQGHTDTTLMGQSRVRLRLELPALTSPLCPNP